MPDRWHGKYVGLPFGDGPGEVTCWSLVRMIYQMELGITLPAYGEVSAEYVGAVGALRSCDRAQVLAAQRRVAACMRRGDAGDSWRVADEPRAFDICAMTAGLSRDASHVGVMIDQQQVLHVERACSAVVEPVNSIGLRNRILGFRRHLST